MLTDGWVQAAKKSGEFVTVLLDEPWPRKLSVGSHGYVQTYVSQTERCALLHRVLLGLSIGDKRIGDHINGNPLDCRRSNLRVVSPAESSANVSGRGSHGVRGVRGVTQLPYGSWGAYGSRDRHRTWLGTFPTFEEAAAVAEAWRLKNLPGYIPADQKS